MKTCPTCHGNFDNEMKFCLEDGSLLVAETASGMTLATGTDATLSAARASKFTPTRLSGQPVKVSGVIVYNFQAQ